MNNEMYVRLVHLRDVLGLADERWAALRYDKY